MTPPSDLTPEQQASWIKGWEAAASSCPNPQCVKHTRKRELEELL